MEIIEQQLTLIFLADFKTSEGMNNIKLNGGKYEHTQHHISFKLQLGKSTSTNLQYALILSFENLYVCLDRNNT